MTTCATPLGGAPSGTHPLKRGAVDIVHGRLSRKQTSAISELVNRGFIFRMWVGVHGWSVDGLQLGLIPRFAHKDLAWDSSVSRSRVNAFYYYRYTGNIK